MTQLKYSEFSEAFLRFLIGNCIPYLEDGGKIGQYNPQYIATEIKIVLNQFGGGYIHALGRDSDTIDFKTMDHFRSQGMITPEQREQINNLTRDKATKAVRNRNIELETELKTLKEVLDSIRGAVGQTEKIEKQP